MDLSVIQTYSLNVVETIPKPDPRPSKTVSSPSCMHCIHIYIYIYICLCVCVRACASACVRVCV